MLPNSINTCISDRTTDAAKNYWFVGDGKGGMITIPILTCVSDRTTDAVRKVRVTHLVALKTSARHSWQSLMLCGPRHLGQTCLPFRHSWPGSANVQPWSLKGKQKRLHSGAGVVMERPPQ